MKNKVLFAVLDWGLGHATRSVPLIRYLNEQHAVLIASSGDAMRYLKLQFPHNEFVKLPSYSPVYAESGMSNRVMLKQLPKLVGSIRKEKQIIDELVNSQHITHIISDNRYGVYSSKIPSVIITHQLQLMLPKNLAWFKEIIQKLFEKLLHPFDEIWIPDDAKRSLSGNLSFNDKFRDKQKFIGWLSALNKTNQVKPTYDYVALISGPEPQRGIFEREITKLFFKLNGKKAIIGGKMQGAPSIKTTSDTKYFSHLLGNELDEVLAETEFIFCRSGYSSVMDLVYLQKNACLVATPLQGEQMYLADYMQEKEFFICCKQDNLAALKETELKCQTALPQGAFDGYKLVLDAFLN